MGLLVMLNKNISNIDIVTHIDFGPLTPLVIQHGGKRVLGSYFLYLALCLFLIA